MKRRKPRTETDGEELKCCALFDDNCSIENLSFRTFPTFHVVLARSLALQPVVVFTKYFSLFRSQVPDGKVRKLLMSIIFLLCLTSSGGCGSFMHIWCHDMNLYSAIILNHGSWIDERWFFFPSSSPHRTGRTRTMILQMVWSIQITPNERDKQTVRGEWEKILNQRMKHEELRCEIRRKITLCRHPRLDL